MATIEYIQKKIAGAEARIGKLEKKIERISKAKETGWEVNPYGYYEDDLRWAQKDLEAAKGSLSKYQAELTAAEEKAASRNVPAITEFLERWKESCRKFYGDGLKKYYEESKAVYAIYCRIDEMDYGSDAYKKAKADYEAANQVFRNKRYGYYEKWEEERNGRKYRGETKVRDGEYEYLSPYNGERKIEDATARLEKDLKDEAERKYDFIIERTNAIVGEITDASGLKVGAKGDLNGYIKGTRGTAKVQTIGAGGYNIQCFHFRTLINKA